MSAPHSPGGERSARASRSQEATSSDGETAYLTTVDPELAKSCKKCHSLSTLRYGMEKHAHAFDSIVKKKHEYDPECVRCHTVGFSPVSAM